MPALILVAGGLRANSPAKGKLHDHDCIIRVSSCYNVQLNQKKLEKRIAMKHLLTAIALLALVGCAATPGDFQQKYHLQAKNIKMHEKGSSPAGDFTVIQFIRSNSCGSKSSSRFTGDWEEAKLLLRLEAATVGADAIVDYKCWTNPMDMVSNCWASKRCEGNAVKFR